MDRERVADGEQCSDRDSPRVRRDLLFPRVIVEFTQLRSQAVVGGIAWGLHHFTLARQLESSDWICSVRR
jgi:hypothetical protein